jgi:hypothetical protein
MKSKEEILFSYMDESLQVSTENQLKAMEDYAHDMAVEFLAWYLQGQPSKFEVDRVITDFENSDYFKEIKARH